jgi:hypothetical protein
MNLILPMNMELLDTATFQNDSSINHSFLKFHAKKLHEDENTHKYHNIDNYNLTRKDIDDENSLSRFHKLFFSAGCNNGRIRQKPLLVDHPGLTQSNDVDDDQPFP